MFVKCARVVLGPHGRGFQAGETSAGRSLWSAGSSVHEKPIRGLARDRDTELLLSFAETPPGGRSRAFQTIPDFIDRWSRSPVSWTDDRGVPDDDLPVGLQRGDERLVRAAALERKHAKPPEDRYRHRSRSCVRPAGDDSGTRAAYRSNCCARWGARSRSRRPTTTCIQTRQTSVRPARNTQQLVHKPVRRNREPKKMG